MSQNIDTARISVIIPAFNEADNIRATLASTQGITNIEVIVVDGGSSDRTPTIALEFGVTVLSAPRSRAQQMNAGAAAATGEILLFLHADTRLPPQFDEMVVTALLVPGTIAGAFALHIDAPMKSLRWVEVGVNWRSRLLQMPYGDQAIFISKQVFHQIGGFPELSFMEDFEMMRCLRREGRIAIIPVPVVTSARRWQQKGVYKTTLMNQIAIVAYLLGVPPKQILHWYRGEKT